MSDSTFRDADSPIRTMKWSSTTRICMGFEFGIGNGLLLETVFHMNIGPLPRRAIDLQARADRLSALAHIQHSKVSRCGGVIGIEASPVVADSKNNPFWAVLKFDSNLRRLAVLDCIGYSFLPDPQQIDLDPARKANRDSLDVHIDFGAAPLKPINYLGQRRGQVS